MISGLVDVFIVAHNNADLTASCIESILKSTYKNVIINLIDNGSEESLKYLLEGIPNSRYFHNDVNDHYAVTINKFYPEATGEFILQINNDAWVTTDCIAHLVNLLNEKEFIGAASPRILNADGSLQCAGNVWVNDVPFGRPVTEEREWLYCGPMDNLTGAVMLVRKSVWDLLEGVDAEYAPGGYEDVDFCMRLRLANYCAWYEGTAIAYHYGHKTFGAHWNEARRNEYYAASGQKSLQRIISKWRYTHHALPYPFDPKDIK